MAKAAPKSSNIQQIEDGLSNGGVFYKLGVRVFVDNPNNFSVNEAVSGYWITNAHGFKTYFKTPTRERAQLACNELFGAGKYKVNTKV